MARIGRAHPAPIITGHGPALEPTRGRVSWVELEVPTVPTRGRASWVELEVPTAAVGGRGLFGVSPYRSGHLQDGSQFFPGFVPAGGAPTPTRGRVSWAELEIPLVPTRGRASWVELEVPTAATRGRVSWVEVQFPDVGGEDYYDIWHRYSE